MADLYVPAVDHPHAIPERATLRIQRSGKTMFRVEAATSGNRPYPSRHTFWKKDLAETLLMTKMSVVYILYPSRRALAMTAIEPIQTKVKTSVNTKTLCEEEIPRDTARERHIISGPQSSPKGFKY